jgi:hypothetical protein
MGRRTNLEQTIDVIESELNDPSVDMGYGALKRAQHRRPRSIVWVRPGGDIDSIPIGGGLLRTAEESAAEGTSTGAPAGDRVDYCYSVIDSAVAVITAEDGAAAEQLMYALLAAIKRACGNHARPGSFTWPVEAAGGSYTHRPSIELRVSFTYLAPESASGLVVILGAQHTHEGDSESDAEHS